MSFGDAIIRAERAMSSERIAVTSEFFRFSVSFLNVTSNDGTVLRARTVEHHQHLEIFELGIVWFPGGRDDKVHDEQRPRLSYAPSAVAAFS